jgi:hypothetical protein
VHVLNVLPLILLIGVLNMNCVSRSLNTELRYYVLMIVLLTLSAPVSIEARAQLLPFRDPLPNNPAARADAEAVNTHCATLMKAPELAGLARKMDLVDGLGFFFPVPTPMQEVPTESERQATKTWLAKRRLCAEKQMAFVQKYRDELPEEYATVVSNHEQVWQIIMDEFAQGKMTYREFLSKRGVLGRESGLDFELIKLRHRHQGKSLDEVVLAKCIKSDASEMDSVDSRPHCQDVVPLKIDCLTSLPRKITLESLSGEVVLRTVVEPSGTVSEITVVSGEHGEAFKTVIGSMKRECRYPPTSTGFINTLTVKYNVK